VNVSRATPPAAAAARLAPGAEFIPTHPCTFSLDNT
jgi:hypothetical protein